MSLHGRNEKEWNEKMTDFRAPPHSLEIEQQVLGAMMLSAEAIDIVQKEISKLKEELWYSRHHITICKAIFDLHKEDKPVDQITVSDRLKRMKKLEEVGGVVYLAKLCSEIGTTANVKYHTGILKEYAVQRNMIRVAQSWIERSHYKEESAPLLGDIAGSVRDMIEVFQGDSAFYTMEGALEEHMEHMDVLLSHKKMVTGISTGFKDLDDSTAGFQKSDMIVIAARPSVGKTALALALARNAAYRGHPVLFFSLEMAQRQLTMRMICAECRIDSMRARRGRLNEDEVEYMTGISNSMAKWPIYFNDEAGLTVEEIRSMARTKKKDIEARSGGDKTLEIVFIDYLQLVHAGVNVQSREQEVAHVSREIKAMAKELDVPVIALAQLSRNVESRPDRKPQLSDLRDSGEIEQNSDLVMFLYRPELYDLKTIEGESLEGLAQVIIGKHRNGPIDTINLQFEKEYGTFEDMPSM